MITDNILKNLGLRLGPFVRFCMCYVCHYDKSSQKFIPSATFAYWNWHNAYILGIVYSLLLDFIVVEGIYGKEIDEDINNSNDNSTVLKTVDIFIGVGTTLTIKLVLFVVSRTKECKAEIVQGLNTLLKFNKVMKCK